MAIEHSMNVESKEPTSAEVKRHWRDFLVAAANWRNKKTPPAVKLAFLSIVIAFALGWAGGTVRGASDGIVIGRDGPNMALAMAVKNSAEGREYIALGLFANVADTSVRQYLSSIPTTIAEKVWEMSSLRYWFSGHSDADLRERVVILAEARLKYLVPPRAETLAEAARLKREWLPRQLADQYERTAQDYSVLLGRTITSKQLVSDAKLRTYLDDVARQSP